MQIISFNGGKPQQAKPEQGKAKSGQPLNQVSASPQVQGQKPLVTDVFTRTKK
jgi:hypothetical protein